MTSRASFISSHARGSYAAAKERKNYNQHKRKVKASGLEGRYATDLMILKRYLKIGKFHPIPPKEKIKPSITKDEAAIIIAKTGDTFLVKVPFYYSTTETKSYTPEWDPNGYYEHLRKCWVTSFDSGEQEKKLSIGNIVKRLLTLKRDYENLEGNHFAMEGMAPGQHVEWERLFASPQIFYNGQWLNFMVVRVFRTRTQEFSLTERFLQTIRRFGTMPNKVADKIGLPRHFAKAIWNGQFLCAASDVDRHNMVAPHRKTGKEEVKSLAFYQIHIFKPGISVAGDEALQDYDWPYSFNGLDINLDVEELKWLMPTQEQVNKISEQDFLFMADEYQREGRGSLYKLLWDAVDGTLAEKRLAKEAAEIEYDRKRQEREEMDDIMQELAEFEKQQRTHELRDATGVYQSHSYDLYDDQPPPNWGIYHKIPAEEQKRRSPDLVYPNPIERTTIKTIKERVILPDKAKKKHAKKRLKKIRNLKAKATLPVIKKIYPDRKTKRY